jgi:asparagine synthase (glutamine-hydrolysing)
MMRGTQLRSFFKTAMKGFLPVEVVRKKKHGFGMPYDVWVQSDPLVSVAILEGVRAFARRGYFKATFVDDLLAACRRGDPRGSSLLWDVAVLEHWMQAHRITS